MTKKEWFSKLQDLVDEFKHAQEQPQDAYLRCYSKFKGFLAEINIEARKWVVEDGKYLLWAIIYIRDAIMHLEINGKVEKLTLEQKNAIGEAVRIITEEKRNTKIDKEEFKNLSKVLRNARFRIIPWPKTEKAPSK